MPNVSIILTSYNHAQYIRHAIDSILNQTYKDYELIIWDDSSTDNSWDIISGYKNPQIKAFRDEKNMGGGTINRALNVATGVYIAIQHSDDIWMTDKLEKQVRFLDEHPEYSAVFTLAQAIDEEGTDFNDPGHYYTTIFNQENRNRFEWLNRFFYGGNCLCHPSVLIRKECYREQTYDERYRQVGDFDFWIKLCLKHEIFILQEKLIKFRIMNNEANSSGVRPETRRRYFLEMTRILRNYLMIHDPVDFRKVFDQYTGENIISELIPYHIARVALQVNSPIHQSFGINTLYDFMGEKGNVELLGRLNDFHYRDFKNITGNYNFFNIPINTARLFIDTGEGFNERESITREIIGNEKRMEFDLSNYNHIQFIRFDPSNCPSVIKLISSLVISREGELQVLTNDNSPDGAIHVFNSSDPRIYFIEPIITNPLKIVIELEYVALGNAVYDYMLKDKDRLIESIYSSYTYKIGRIITLTLSLKLRAAFSLILESIKYRLKIHRGRGIGAQVL